MYSKAHQILGAWEDSPTPTPRNGSRTPSLRLKSANISRKGSIVSFDNAPNPERPASKGPLHRLLHSRSAMTLGMKCRRDRGVDSPMPQMNTQAPQWPPYRDAMQTHSPSAALASSSRNSSARSSAFHLPFRPQESANLSRSGSLASQTPPIQPGPNAFRNQKNLAIHPVRHSMISTTGTRSPLLETPILENMFRPQELQEAGKTNPLAGRFSRFSRERISSGLRRMFPTEHQPEPRASKLSEGTEANTRIVSLYERDSYDPTTNYFHGFDGHSVNVDDDLADIGQAHGYDPRTEPADNGNMSDHDDGRHMNSNLEYQGMHAMTTDETSHAMGHSAPDPGRHLVSAHTREERNQPSRTPKHSSGDVVKHKEGSLQGKRQPQLQTGMTMLALSDSDDSDDDTVKKAKQVKIVRPPLQDLSDVEEEEFIEEDSLQSQYAHICGGAGIGGRTGNSSTFTSSRSTTSNLEDQIRALYESDDQGHSDRTSITSTDSLVPPPLSAAQSRPTSSHKPHVASSFDKKDRKLDRVSKPHSSKHSAEDLRSDPVSQTMAVTPDEYALISSLRKKRAAMQRQLLKEGYRTAMKEQLAKWEHLRERAFSDLEAAADLESKDLTKRAARRPSLPSSPKKRPHRSATFGDIPSGRKRAKSNEDIPDLPLPRSISTKDFEPTKGSSDVLGEPTAPKVESEQKSEHASNAKKSSKVSLPVTAAPSTPRQAAQVGDNLSSLPQSSSADVTSPPSPEDVMRASWAMVNHELAKNKFPIRPSVVRKSSKLTNSEKSTKSVETKENTDIPSAPSSEVYSSSDLNSISVIDEEGEPTDVTPTNTSDMNPQGRNDSTEEAAIIPLPSSPIDPRMEQVNENASRGYESPSIFGRISPIPSKKDRDTIIFSPVEIANISTAYGTDSGVSQSTASDRNGNRNTTRWSSIDDAHDSLDEEELLLMLDDAVAQNGFADDIRTPESQIGMAYEPEYASPTAARRQQNPKSPEHQHQIHRVVATGSPSAPPKTGLPLPQSYQSATPSRSQQSSISHSHTIAQQPKQSKIPTPSGVQRTSNHTPIPSFSRPRPHNPTALSFSSEEQQPQSSKQSKEYNRVPGLKTYHSSQSSQSNTPTGGRSRNGSTSAASDVLRAWDDLGGYPRQKYTDMVY